MEDRILYGLVINRLGELITLAVFSLTDLILCGLQYKKEIRTGYPEVLHRGDLFYTLE